MNLQLRITDSKLGDDVVDRLTQNLRRDLLDLGVEQVNKPIAGLLPTGIKSADIPSVGALIATLAVTILPNLIDFLQALAMRTQGPTYTIKTAYGREIQFNATNVYTPDELTRLTRELESDGGAAIKAWRIKAGE